MQHSGIVYPNNQHIVYFVGNTTAGVTPDSLLHTWTIPKEARFLYITAIGGGSGGTAGEGNTAGTSRTGGGGGGPGGICHAIFQARMLSPTLYISVGQGGIGGNTSALPGIAGTSSTVATTRVSVPTQEATLIIANGAAAPVNATAGGAAGAISGFGSMRLAYRALGINLVTAQAAGGTGGTAGGAAPSNLAPLGFISGGAGGGGTSTTTVRAGASIIAQNPENTFGVASNGIIVQGGATAGPVNGCDGHTNLLDMNSPGPSAYPGYSLGGAGGASSDTGQGGNGGHGGVGGGGGGGGAGVTGQFGIGGNAGPGLVIIEWW